MSLPWQCRLVDGCHSGIVLGCFAASLCRLRWSHGCCGPADQKWEGLDVCEQFTLQQMLSATNNWSEENVLGKGGFGIVYKGRSPQGQLWAIKRSTIMTNDFETENVETGKQEQILVYEFMANRDLQYHIHRTKRPLSLRQRLRLAQGAAEGLAYLHGVDTPIVHRDIKPANILVTGDMQAKVADFGLLKRLTHGDADATRVVGTPGYVDPDYNRTNVITTKSDVFREDEWESVAKEESEGNKGMSSRDVSSTSLEDSGRESGRSQGSQSCASSFMRIGLIGLPLCTGPPHPLAPSTCSADSCLAATPVRCLLPLRCPPPARCSPRLFCPQPSLLASQPAVVPSSPSPVLCQCGTVAWEVVRALFQPLVLHMHPSAPSPPAAPFSPAALAPASPASCQCGTVAWEVLWALFQHLVSHMHQSAPSPNFAPSALSALAAPSPASPALCLCGIVAWEEVQVLPFLHRASQTHPSAPTAPAAFMPASPASCLCGIVAWEEVQVLVI
ncbi:unnamed protein product [Closterium sp. NIES-64]|nr:unnamed protein product [Closterium sp. NIES-64]